MKYQDLFSLKNKKDNSHEISRLVFSEKKKKKKKMSSAADVIGALRVKSMNPMLVFILECICTLKVSVNCQLEF